MVMSGRERVWPGSPGAEPNSTASGWANGAITLEPGEGAFLCPCCSNGFTVTFTGCPHPDGTNFVTPLGLVLSTIILIVLSSAASTEFRATEALVSSVLLAAAVVGVFVFGLHLQLPIWPGAK